MREWGVTITRHAAILVATIIATLFVWLGVRLGEEYLLMPSLHGGCQGFGAYERHDPLCAIDPTCVSPVYTGAIRPNWQGVLAVGTVNLSGRGEESFALPNYAAFLGTGILLFLGIRRWLPTRLPAFWAHGDPCLVRV